MFQRLARGLIAGAAGALVVAVLEPLLGAAGRGTTLRATAVAAGVLLPVGVLVGLGLAVVGALVPGVPGTWLRALRAPAAPATSARVLAVGAVGPPLLLATYHLARHFMTAYHHRGLAALALSVALFALGGVALLLRRRVAELLGDLLGRGAGARRWLRRPVVATALVAVGWAALVGPPLAAGVDAIGPFAFLGLLRKDGVAATPLLSLLLLVLVAGVLSLALARWPVRLGVVALAVVLGALVGPLEASAALRRWPAVIEPLAAPRGLVGVTLRVGRRLGDHDGDGYSRWLGGRDCDDDSPAIHPDARDIPDNGIDEDCSGDDLRLAALAAPASAPAAAAPLRRPALPADLSLLLITVDTLRWDEPGFMGYHRPVTPNLDRLAARGVVYERAYALGSYTAHSIPCLMTGKYASELRRNDRHEMRVAQQETFAAERICADGVRCAAFLPHFLFRRGFGWNQGFGEWTVVGAEPAGPGHLDTKYNSHLVTRAATRWLAQPENTAGRFWLWVHYNDPHKEYIAHRGFPSFGSDQRARYDHEVLYTDHQIGQLLEAFAALPAARRTVVVMTADHGEAFREHGELTHGRELWDEIIRVPLVVAGPGVAAKRVTRPTSHIDLFPTLLDLFGVAAPPGGHGRSLLPDWVAGQELPARPVVADQPRNPYFEPRRVFIADGWKLHHLPARGTYRLFRVSPDWERGESLATAEPEAFARTKAAYRRFLATELRPLDPVWRTPRVAAAGGATPAAR